MIALAIAAPAALGVALAVLLRGWLQRLSLMTWLGWTLIGAGLPVAMGQLVALALSGAAERQAEACAAGQAAACDGAGLLIILPLTAGLAGGLGWAAGAVSARLGARRPPS